MNFGDMSEAPKPKRRKASKAGKSGKAAHKEGEEAVAMEDSPSGTNADASGEPASSELADSEPAKLTRTGAAEVVADATTVASQGVNSSLNLYCFKPLPFQPLPGVGFANFACRQAYRSLHTRPSECRSSVTCLIVLAKAYSAVHFWHYLPASLLGNACIS